MHCHDEDTKNKRNTYKKHNKEIIEEEIIASFLNNKSNFALRAPPLADELIITKK